MKNTLIVLSERKLGHLLEMPKTGICYSSLKNDFVRLRWILERDDIENFDFHKAKQLFAELRLLHSIVSRIIFPKTGYFDWIAKRELAVMYYLADGITINLPFMILE